MDAYLSISLHTQAFIRTAYGALMLATLAFTLPQAPRFFLSERWGGYAKHDRFSSWIQNPLVLPVAMVAWFSANVLLVLNCQTVLAGLVNLLLCRYFFIDMRWRGILRGMGAPGFMSYWLAACVFFLEYARYMDPSLRVLPVVLLVFKVDFAVIMICAGQYKLFSGYPRNNGMELGLVNPFWGRWWWLYKKIPPNHLLYRSLNHLAYLTEIGAAVLMLIPATQAIGALGLAVSFVWIACNIRLAFLCEMVILACFLYVGPDTFGDGIISRVVGTPSISPQFIASAPAWLNESLRWALIAYVGLLPIVKGMMYYNFYARKRFGRLIQWTLDTYTNFFGIIIWRVFSVDVINFFVNVYVQNPDGGRILYSRPGKPEWRTRFRYTHVGEFICFTSLFTTLKYYPSQQAIFKERLVRYARTIPCPAGGVVVFEYIAIRKTPSEFTFAPVLEYYVDWSTGSIEQKVLDPAFSPHKAADTSPVHEGARPGTYAPMDTDQNY